MKKTMQQKIMFWMITSLIMMAGSAHAGDNQNTPRFIIVPPGVMIPVYHQRPARTQVQAPTQQRPERAATRVEPAKEQKRQQQQQQQRQAYDSQLNTMFLILAR